MICLLSIEKGLDPSLQIIVLSFLFRYALAFVISQFSIRGVDDHVLNRCIKIAIVHDIAEGRSCAPCNTQTVGVLYVQCTYLITKTTLHLPMLY